MKVYQLIDKLRTYPDELETVLSYPIYNSKDEHCGYYHTSFTLENDVLLDEPYLSLKSDTEN